MGEAPPAPEGAGDQACPPSANPGVWPPPPPPAKGLAMFSGEAYGVMVGESGWLTSLGPWLGFDGSPLFCSGWCWVVVIGVALRVD